MFLLPLTAAVAQRLTPQFEFTLYAEDALGNKDSVVIAYDQRALPFNSGDTTFGERELVTSFRRPFEMRLIRTDDFGKKHSTKRGIYPYRGNCNTEAESDIITIAYRVSNLPVKLRWNKNLFSLSDRSYPALCYGRATLYDWRTLFYRMQRWSSTITIFGS
jgi:hypothetical protein